MNSNAMNWTKTATLARFETRGAKKKNALSKQLQEHWRKGRRVSNFYGYDTLAADARSNVWHERSRQYEQSERTRRRLNAQVGEMPRTNALAPSSR